MPELPEVETVRRSLAEAVFGRCVVHARLVRRDIHRGAPALRRGDVFADTARHGKQLALVTERGTALCVHLGMSGQLRLHPRRINEASTFPDHTHARWTLDDGNTLAFTDPRRFGGLWSFSSVNELQASRWGVLGPDALVVTPTRLHRRLQRTTRAVKAALLDQHVVAGLGNIYVDELLHAVRLSPLTPADTLSQSHVSRLVRAMRRILNRAIGAGGSTLRDHVDGHGQTGGFQRSHQVYGRAGLPCHRCGGYLVACLVAGRTTTSCPRCQPYPTREPTVVVA